METIGSPVLWVAFLGFVLLMLALDLGVFNRKSHVITFKEAAVWSGVWVALSLLLGGWIFLQFGSAKGTEYLTGYVIEKSLSVDNIFVFVMIFGALKIPAIYQHRVLFWGILTALVLRAIMIFAGAAAIERFHWLIYVFGAFLILTGLKMFFASGKVDAPEDSALMRWVQKMIPSTNRLDGERFFTEEERNGKFRRLATPLFMALVLIEFSDVIFAVDSIPAIFAITTDPFIVFTSNIFAILGLRSLYFMLAGLVDKFRYLKVGLAAVLTFVGVKMIIVGWIKIPSGISLAVILSMLAISIWASLAAAKREELAGVPKA
jgi:tellurite resistance protein TerC